MKHLRFIILMSLLSICFTGQAGGQDQVIIRSSLLHPELLNPAITGSAFVPQACLSYMKYWTGIPQSPQTLLASTSIRIGNYDFYNPKKLIYTSGLKSRERVGLGIAIFSDSNGPAVTRGIHGTYAYHIQLKKASLSLGITGKAEQRILDGNLFQPTYPGDPVLTGIRESFTSPNADIGAYYYSAKLIGGAAVHNIIPLEDKINPGSKVKPDLVLHGGYLFSSFGKPNMEINLNVRYLDMDVLEYELYLRTYIRKIHWIAVSYKSYRALAFHLGLSIRDIYLAYSFESSLSNIVRYNMGSHGIHLGINLGMRRFNRS
ncbi:MAG: PorP/SprF family type IX secretion system membrane protein [Bacteroidota bacterium]